MPKNSTVTRTVSIVTDGLEQSRFPPCYLLSMFPERVQSCETRFRVRYAETDQMGVVYHANYLIWMEIGRSELCRSMGVTYRDMELNDGVRLAVIDAHCEYRSPAHYDEEIVVITSVAAATRRMVKFAYEIRNSATNRELARGDTKHIFLNKEMRPARLPEKYHEAFGIYGL